MATRTASQPIAHMTEQEYLALGDVKPYREYLDGIVVEKVMGNRDHVNLADELQFRLHLYRRRAGGRSGPEARVRFFDGRRVFYCLPDVAYWAPDRPQGPNEGMNPPTLAVEIRSPGESMHAQREKCASMHALGVDVCWLVDPDVRTVEVFESETVRRLDERGVLESEHLPGFALPLTELFSVLDG